MRAVVGALFKALPGTGSILAVLMLVFYIAAVMATNLFGERLRTEALTNEVRQMRRMMRRE
jgi:hypothetical protein